MNQRYVIGIGSQRAGSTLLSRLLEVSSSVTMHPLKELHYFDTLYGYRPREALVDFSNRQIARELEKIVSADSHGYINKRYRCYLRSNLILSKNKIEDIDYLDLYRPLVGGSKYLGEVTPEYMLFNRGHVEKMKTVVGRDASIILLCRNPVKRIVSALKLLNQYNGLNMSAPQADAWLNRAIEENGDWIKHQDLYNNYQQAIDAYGQCFDRFVAISYDDMIQQPGPTSRLIEEAIEVPIDESKFMSGVGQVVNNLGHDIVLSENTLKKLEIRYEKDIAYLNSHFERSVSQ